ncbi:hypothetical protein V144x_00460 [Gimesia aquarii]|uniref:Uncharacterized protein n=2 Tax=Gimesia aquarii TaxID=2527964 RepID=A0A517VNM2_9PLAN|nr:hypothetical protein V144x_00460 [Gimesia aquarii]
MLSRVCRSLRWQLDAGSTPEELASKYGNTIAMGGLIYETQSLELLQDYNLPESLTSVVRNVVHRTHLWPDEKLDTARELSAHFADGLEKGSTPEELIKLFGSPKTAARLIRRASLRNRPFAWRATRRIRQATIFLMVVLIPSWIVLNMRFMRAIPTVKFDLVQEIDDQSRAIPKQERAWPLYRQGLVELNPDVKKNYSPIQDGLNKGPKSKHWTEAKAFLAKHSDILTIFLEATSRPKLGFINRDPGNSVWLLSYHHDKWFDLNPPSLTETGFSILIPQMQDLGSYVLPMLTGALHLAVEQGDSDRYLQLLRARLRLAEHYRQIGPFPFCQINANGITGHMAQEVGKLVIEHPDLFDEEQLAMLLQSLADAQIRKPDFRQDERIFINDFLQKTYTDDGTGNGRFTPHGFQLLEGLAEHSKQSRSLFASTFAVPADPREQQTHVTQANTFHLLAAPVATMIAGRKEMQAELIHLNKLLWKQRTNALTADPSVDSEYITEYRRLLDSPSLRLKYLPALIMMPNEEAPTFWSQTPRHQVQRDAALIMIAAERYRQQHGQFPKTAEELVPAFLPAVPIDPYTNKPLRYSIKEGHPMINSFGLNSLEEEVH